VDKFEKRSNQKAVDMLVNLSPTAWRHIQLAGYYSFGDQKFTIDLEGLLDNVDPLDTTEQDLVAA